MADKITLEIDGLKELTKKYERLGKNIKKDVILPSVKKSMRKAVKIAKRKVPVDTGELRRHIVWGMSRAKDKDSISAAIFVRKNRNLTKRELIKADLSKLKFNKKGKAIKEVYYAHLVEYGTIKSKASPFIRPAMKEADPVGQLKKDVDKALKEQGLK